MDIIQSGFRALIRSDVRRCLRGVWLRGALPQGGAVLAVNHHSWWDGYVLGEVSWTFGRTPNMLMDEAQLARFPFFRLLGVLGARELRPALRRLQGGEWLWVFPEAEVRPAGALAPIKDGSGWLARNSGVPLIPVALRVVMRGQQHPEAYLRVGEPTVDLAADLSAVLAALDAELLASDPERPLAGYLQLTAGARSAPERLARPARWLRGWLERQ